MTVTLTPELERIVESKVHTGRYKSAGDVVKEALRLLNERDQLIEVHKDDIRRKIEEGLASLRAGKGTDGEEVMAQMLAEVDDEIRVEDEQARNSRR